ncbi:MAG: hypothetical protein HY892_16435 [Deltaproteobacteria bacterium]|nr:hypothetical protein [Deltaproteobacteria bacterium]
MPPIPHPLENEVLMKRVDLMAVNAKFEAARTGEEGAIWAITIERWKRLVLNSLAGSGKNNRSIRED